MNKIEKTIEVETQLEIVISKSSGENIKLLNEICDEIDKMVQHEKLKLIWNKLKGYVLTITFALCSCISSILVKKSFALSGADSGVIRYFVQIIAMLIIAKYKKLNPLGEKGERKLLTYRGLTGITSLIFGYFAVKYINPSDFKVINHTSIIITVILARIFLKEKLTIAHIFALIMTIAGVLLISKPSFILSIIFVQDYNNQTNFTTTFIKEITQTSFMDRHSLLIGISFALVGAFGSGSSRVILKMLCTNNVHFSIATIYASYFGLPVCLTISTVLILTGVSHSNFSNELEHLPLHIFYNFIAALIGITGQCVLNIALKYEDASKLAIVKTIDVFYAFILQYLFLNIQADVFSIIGAVTIVSAAFLVLVFRIIENEKTTKK